MPPSLTFWRRVTQDAIAPGEQPLAHPLIAFASESDGHCRKRALVKIIGEWIEGSDLFFVYRKPLTMHLNGS
jgi:hypothetical protein